MVVIPRPSPDQPTTSPQVIEAPTEAAFTSTFGHLLPPARYLHTPNGKTAYYSLPPTSPTPTPEHILLIHGSSIPTAQFVLLDLYGHGLSDTPLVPHTPALFQEQLETLLDTLEWPWAHLVGYSFGGSVAAGFLVSRPNRVRSLSLIAPAGLYRSQQFEARHLRGEDEVAARHYVL
ncbi:hypothetical protein MBLNU230_g5210t1 [Neophaeotheca triangularis]